MIDIIHADTESHIPEVYSLFQEYATSLGFDLCFQNFDEELLNLPGTYAQPKGCLLLALEDHRTVGCVAMRPLDDTVCEMKRLYVKPKFRGKGIGRFLAEAIIAEAKQVGYHRMRLDTVPSMRQAIALYQSLGFKQIPPYCQNPIPSAMYFQLNLDGLVKSPISTPLVGGD